MKWSKLKKHVNRDVAESKRLVKALKKVAPFLSDDAVRDLHVFCPPESTLGGVFAWSGVVMFLRSDWRGWSQEEIDFTVAHEFAHLTLKHPQRQVKPCRKVEREATALARKWGFDSPYED